MRLFVVLAWLVLAAGCATVRPAPDVELPATQPIDAWGHVLDRFVDDRGRVDFEELQRDRADLDRFVAWVYAVGPNNRPELFPAPDDKLAYHINAYNALAMWKILEVGIPEDTRPLEAFLFFLAGPDSGGRGTDVPVCLRE